MKIYETERDSIDEIKAALTPVVTGPDTELAQKVAGIIADVRSKGDAVLLELGRKFDAPELERLQATDADFADAYASVSPKLLEAIRAAKANIEEFHKKQVQKSWIDMHNDFSYGQIVRPLDTVGIYAPAGLAPLPSTVLMTAIPAKVAGVRQVVMCSPAQKGGKINNAMLVAAKECGVDCVFAVGGAQAAAAMAYGTQSIPRVDKIVGPGNVFFTEAKRQLFGIVGIDQLAGPSEILIIADDSANPAYVAADILSQAEHAEDSRCVLLTDSRELADASLKEVKHQTDTAGRAEYIRKSLEGFGVVVLCRDMDECIKLANFFAPEHLELAVSEPWEILRKIKNAGTIMVGHYTPVPLCDFAAGPNHTLPTGGTARFSSALSVDEFIKKSGLLAYTREGLQRMAPVVLEMASAEGLPAHGNTVRIRVEEQLNPQQDRGM